MCIVEAVLQKSRREETATVNKITYNSYMNCNVMRVHLFGLHYNYICIRTIHVLLFYGTCTLLPLIHHTHASVHFLQSVLNHNGICNIVNKECETQWLSAVHLYLLRVWNQWHTLTGMHTCSISYLNFDSGFLYSNIFWNWYAKKKKKKVNAKTVLIQLGSSSFLYFNKLIFPFWFGLCILSN